MKVLIVEDNPVTVESLEALLKLEGHEVDHASSYADAIARLEVFRPDAMLVDVRLPGGLLNGLDLIEEVLRRRDLANCKLFLTTAMEEDVIGPPPPGVKLLRKPFDPNRLLDLLREVKK